MKNKILVIVISILLTPMLAVGAAQAHPANDLPSNALASNVGTAFTYQGQLNSNGAPVNATCDFQFSLFDAESSGTQIGSTQNASNVAVTDGLFTVQIDFGKGAFTGAASWLGIAVRCPAGSGSYTSLAPLQPLTPAPLALSLPGLYTQQNSVSPNIIGGYWGNLIPTGVLGSTISGGGNSSYPNQVKADYATIGGGLNNSAFGYYGVVGGGNGNTTGKENDNKDYDTVSGGYSNEASGGSSVVGGGWENTAIGGGATVAGGSDNLASQNYDTVGGGNMNQASGGQSVVGGGHYNYSTGDYAAITGGQKNFASGAYATVGGGYDNWATNASSVVGGGYANEASGYRATVPGGAYNTASGAYSFAAGFRAKANHDGSFIFADDNPFDFTTYLENTFEVRATGGVFLSVDIDGEGHLPVGCHLHKTSNGWYCYDNNDRSKDNSIQLNGRTTLDQLATVPIMQWTPNEADPSVKHFSPIAEDFNAAFGLSNGDQKGFSSMDLDSVALNSIQGLYQIVQEKDQQISDLEARVAQLEQKQTPASTSTPFNWFNLLGATALLGGVGLWRQKGGA